MNSGAFFSSHLVTHGILGRLGVLLGLEVDEAEAAGASGLKQSRVYATTLFLV